MEEMIDPREVLGEYEQELGELIDIMQETLMEALRDKFAREQDARKMGLIAACVVQNLVENVKESNTRCGMVVNFEPRGNHIRITVDGISDARNQLILRTYRQ